MKPNPDERSLAHRVDAAYSRLLKIPRERWDAELEQLDPDVGERLQRLRGEYADPLLGTQLGPYVFEERLAGGGMGAVYIARQEQPVQRRVVIKAAGSTEPLGAQRFELERQAQALMDHPAIARVFETGELPDGRPYLVMEFVPGEPVTTYCDGLRLGLRPRLELFRQICEAVEHAHRKGVIHRDLKPGNVLARDQDGAHEVRVIDFGIAKFLGGPRADATGTGVHLGTPGYCSPEQLEAVHSVDTRTDVYNLGLLLCDLLAGVHPDVSRSDAADATGAGPAGLFRRLDDQQRARAARDRGLSVAALARVLGGELTWIAERALQREPDGRYQSAIALGDDVSRHLCGEPVEAGPPSWRYRASKVLWRHRWRSAAALATLLLLAVSGGWWVNQSIERQLQAPAVRRMLLLTEPALYPIDHGRLGPATHWRAVADKHRELDVDVALLAADLEGIEDVARRELSAWLDADAEAFDMVFARVELMVAAVRAHDPVRWQSAWDDARQVAREADVYAPGVQLEPLAMLVPLGVDPRSGLLEFADVRTGQVPGRDAEGRLVLDGDSAVVFVLLPGAEAVPMGVDDPALVTDITTPLGLGNSVPMERVSLAPFLMGKYEITQGQYARVMGLRPSQTSGSLEDGDWRWNSDDRSPLDSISRAEAGEFARRLGHVLPTEARWEYAANLGRAFPADKLRSRLEGTENTADLAYMSHGTGNPTQSHAPWDDGHAITSPVGVLRANAFGLHDVLGNVSEWCREKWYAPYGRELASGPDGLRAPPEGATAYCVARGGNWRDVGPTLPAHRQFFENDGRHAYVGMRLARSLVAP